MTVDAGDAGTTGWRGSWPLATGQGVGQWWNAGLTSDGTMVIAENASWNGALAPHAHTTITLLGSYRQANPAPAVACSPS